MTLRKSMQHAKLLKLVSIVATFLLLLPILIPIRPVPAVPDFSFAVSGDIGSIWGTSNGKKTLDRLVATNPSFFIALGDLTYGANNTGQGSA